jgi:hypothetical protein
MKQKESNEYFQIVDGVKTDRYLFWEELLEDQPELINKIYASEPEEQPALIKKFVDERMLNISQSSTQRLNNTNPKGSK